MVSTGANEPKVWPKVQPLLFRAEDSVRQLLNLLQKLEQTNPGLERAATKLVSAAADMEEARQMLFTK